MKYLFLTITIIGFVWGVAKVTHYEERMTEYNKYMCANYGMRADCHTPLPENERLKPYEETIN